VAHWIYRTFGNAHTRRPTRGERGQTPRRILLRRFSLTACIFLCLIGSVQAQQNWGLLRDDRYVVTIVHRTSLGPGLDDPVTSLLEHSGCARAEIANYQGAPQWILRGRPCRFSSNLLFAPDAIVLTVARALPAHSIIRLGCNLELTPLGRALHWLPGCVGKSRISNVQIRP